MNNSLETTLKALQNMKIDGLYKTKTALRLEQLGKTERSKAEILQNYEELESDITEAIRWVRSLCSK